MRKRFFHGDTLVEVAIAIGIFSLVAISIVAVINTGTSGIQTTLETTATRNEINAAAESLRYIHDAYEAEKNLESSEQTYASLWDNIVALAEANRDNDLQITEFSPTTCAELYDSDSANSIFKQNTFIINPQLLSSDTPTSALVSVNSNASVFSTTPLYPRIFTYYSPESTLISNDLLATNENLKAQGIYIIPIADQGTCVNGDSECDNTTYYDFYIRACWDAAGSNTPSTISTVVRLYNPDVDVIDSQLISYALVFDTNESETTVPTKTREVRKSETTFALSSNDYTTNTNNPSQKMLGWAVTGTADPCGNSILSTADAKTLWGINLSHSTSQKVTSVNPIVHLSPIWQCTYSVTFDKNTTDYVPNVPNNVSATVQNATYETALSSSAPTRAGYQFCGWRDIVSNKIYDAGDTIKLGTSWTGYKQNIDLSATWKYKYILNYYGNDNTTIYRTVTELSSNSTTHTFTIDQDAPTPTPTNNSGIPMTFMGWSLNKDGSGTVYKKGGGDDAQPTISTSFQAGQDSVINLYPIWRIKISFNGVDWKKINNSCSRWRCMGDIGISDTSTGGQVVFTGDYYGPVDVSVYYDIGVNDIFELSADMVTSGMKTHPGGFVEIRIGPLVTQITKPSDYSNNIRVTSSCQGSVTKNVYLNSDTVNIKMTKYGSDYAMSFDGDTLAACTVPNYSNPIRVSYRMYHNSHACNIIFTVTLKNIQMMRLMQD